MPLLWRAEASCCNAENTTQLSAPCSPKLPASISSLALNANSWHYSFFQHFHKFSCDTEVWQRDAARVGILAASCPKPIQQLVGLVLCPAVRAHLNFTNSLSLWQNKCAVTIKIMYWRGELKCPALGHGEIQALSASQVTESYRLFPGV